jgi:hypothetical protein
LENRRNGEFPKKFLEIEKDRDALFYFRVYVFAPPTARAIDDAKRISKMKL